MIKVSLHRPTVAEAKSVQDAHWVDIRAEDGGEVTIFCECPERAQAIAAAINAADAGPEAEAAA